MMFRARTGISVLSVVMAALALLSGCSQPASAPSSSQAQAMNASVITAVGSAFAGSGSGAPLSLVRVGTTVDPLTVVAVKGMQTWSGPGYTITGMESTLGVYPETFDLTITFNGYSADGVTFNSGSAALNMTVTDATDLTATYSGSFDITYQGTPYTFSWTINISVTSSTASYTGSFTINGTTYSYSA